MKKIILITFCLIFISNLGLNSYASENDSNKYYLEQQYKKSFFISNENNIIIDIDSKKEDINPDTWLWSFVFPGLGHIMLGETTSGLRFMLPNIFFLLVTTVSLYIGLSDYRINEPYTNAIIHVLSFPSAIASILCFIVSYIANIIDAIHINSLLIEEKLNKKNLRKNKNSIDITFRDNYFNMSF